MDGILYTIDKLGSTLAATEAQLAAVQRENAVLREQLAQNTPASRNDSSTTG